MGSLVGCITNPDPGEQYGACPGHGTVAPGPGPNPDTAALFAPAVIDLHLEISDADWAMLTTVREQCAGLRRCEELDEGDAQPCCAPELRKTYVPARFSLSDGERVDAHVRLKGNPRDWKPDKKHQFVIRFNKEDKSGRFMGLRRLNLDSNPSDESLVRNNVSMHLMRHADVIASRTNHARLWIGDRLFGLYEHIEAVDKEFVEDRFADASGNLYKHAREVGLKTNESAPNHTALHNWWDAFENGRQWLFDSLDCVADVDSLLRVMAAEAVLPASDNLWADDFNFYLYMDEGGPTVIPWDLDDVIYHNAGWAADLFSLHGLREGDLEDPGHAGELWHDIQGNPVWRERFLRDVEDILDSVYRKLPARIDALCCGVRESIVLEAANPHPWRPVSSYRTLSEFEDDCGRLMQRVRCRTQYLDAVLRGDDPPTACAITPDGQPLPVTERLTCADTPLGDLGDFAINEVSSVTDRIEIVNRGDNAAWFVGWTLSETPSPGERTLAPRFVPPGDRVVLLEAEHDVSLDTHGEVYLLDPTGEVHDSAVWCSGGAKPSWCRVPDITGEFTVCDEPTFGAANVGQSGLLPSVIVEEVEGIPLEPERVAFDSDGRLWVGERDQGRIRVLEDHTLVDTISSIAAPEGMASFGDRMYVVDDGALRAFDGATRALLDTVVIPVGEDLRGLAIDAAGRFYVADNDLGLVVLIDGTTITALNPTAIGGAPLPDAEVLALDPTGQRLFVASVDTPRIDTFDLLTGAWKPDGAIGAPQTGAAPEPGRFAGQVAGLAVDPVASVLFTVDRNNDRIMLHALDGGLGSAADDYGFLAAFGVHGNGCTELDSPRGLALAHGRLAVADDGNDRVVVYTLDALYASLGVP